MTDFLASDEPITGKKVSLILIGFFVVIIGVNAIMLTFAVRTFSGLVVDNSYIASQTFDLDVASAQSQPINDWSIKMLDRAPFIIEIEGVDGRPLQGVTLSAELVRPTERAVLTIDDLKEIAPGVYSTDVDLAPGQWSARLTLPDGQSRTLKLIAPRGSDD